MGGATILDGNIHSLFDHQTVLEDSNEGNIQRVNSDFHPNMQINEKRIISGIDEIVPITEKDCLHCHKAHVVPGEIKRVDFKHDSPLPIHVPAGQLDPATWYITYEVYGGYEAFGTDGVLEFYQKGAWISDNNYEKIKVGEARVDWLPPVKKDPTDPTNCWSVWTGHFIVDTPFSLKSDQYPTIDPTCCTDVLKWQDNDPLGQYIPYKYVTFDIYTDWKGCDKEDQYFTVLSVRDNYQFPK